jgi:hypothetical protein
VIKQLQEEKMNLESILPLLMGNGANPQMNDIMSLLKGGNGNMADILKGQDGKNNVLDMLKNQGGKGNDMMNLFSMMNAQKKPSKQGAFGLKPIYNIAPTDILGIMVKYLSK